MYAQLVRSRATRQKRAEMHRLVADELIPALHDEPGFAGALSLVSFRDGEAMMIVLWQSAEQARRPLGDNGSNVVAPLLLRIAGAAPGKQQRTSIWEVTVHV